MRSATRPGFGCNDPLEENVEPLFELSVGGGNGGDVRVELPAGGEILRLFRDCDGWVVAAGCAGWVPTGDNDFGGFESGGGTSLRTSQSWGI